MVLYLHCVCRPLSGRLPYNMVAQDGSKLGAEPLLLSGYSYISEKCSKCRKTELV